MSNQGKVWDIREAYNKIRANDWSLSEGAPLCMWGGGATPSTINVIDKVNPLTTGNATDFGDLVAARQYMGGAGNKVKGVFGGGDGASNVIQTFNFQTEGNCSDFGDLTTGRLGLAGCGNEIVCLFGGGDNAPSYYNIIDPHDDIPIVIAMTQLVRSRYRYLSMSSLQNGEEQSR